VSDALDPEEVLGTILGPLPNSAKAASGPKEAGPVTEDDLDLDYDFGGLALREFASQEADADKGNTYRPQTVEDCRLQLLGVLGIFFCEPLLILELCR
jgi:hypothetical protein